MFVCSTHKSGAEAAHRNRRDGPKPELVSTEIAAEYPTPMKPGLVPILEQSCRCKTTAAGNSWRRCLKLNGPTQISAVPIEFLIYRQHRVAQILVAASSSHFCAGHGDRDRRRRLPHTEWLPEKLCIGAEVVGHQRVIRE